MSSEKNRRRRRRRRRKKKKWSGRWIDLPFSKMGFVCLVALSCASLFFVFLQKLPYGVFE
jgi:hypothetical protein